MRTLICQAWNILCIISVVLAVLGVSFSAIYSRTKEKDKSPKWPKILATLSVGAFFVFGFTHLDSAKVPNVVGVSVNSARQTLQENDLLIESNDYSPNDIVTFQSIKPGRYVRNGSEIEIVAIVQTQDLTPPPLPTATPTPAPAPPAPATPAPATPAPADPPPTPAPISLLTPEPTLTLTPEPSQVPNENEIEQEVFNLSQQGEHEQAIELLQEAIALYSGSDYIVASFYAHLGAEYKLIDDTDHAIESYKNSLDLIPNNDLVLWNIACLYRDIGQYESAIPYYRTCMAVNGDSSSLWEIVLCYRNLNQTEDAKYYCNLIINDYQDNPNVLEAKEYVDNN